MNVNAETLQTALFGEFYYTGIQICLEKEICQSQSGMMISFDICIIAVTCMTAPISKFLDSSSEAVTFWGKRVTFWYSWLSKKGHSWALQMKPLICRATFEWFRESSTIMEHPVHSSGQVIHEFALSLPYYCIISRWFMLHLWIRFHDHLICMAMLRYEILWEYFCHKWHISNCSLPLLSPHSVFLEFKLIMQKIRHKTL